MTTSSINITLKNMQFIVADALQRKTELYREIYRSDDYVTSVVRDFSGEFENVRRHGYEFCAALDKLEAYQYENNGTMLLLVDNSKYTDPELGNLISTDQKRNAIDAIRWFYEKYGENDTLTAQQAVDIAKSFTYEDFNSIDCLLKFPVTDVAARRLSILFYYIVHDEKYSDVYFKEKLIPKIIFNQYVIDGENVFVLKVGDADDEEYTDAYAVVDRLIAMGPATIGIIEGDIPRILSPYLSIEWRFDEYE